MMLQALYRLAQREGLADELDLQWARVAWLVRLDERGRLLGIEGTHTTPPAEGKRKPRPVAKSMQVPRQTIRTSAPLAQLLVDKAEYVFGLDPAGKRPARQLRQRADLFRVQVRDAATATADPGVQTVAAFLDDLDAGRQNVTLPEDCASNDLFAFVVSPDVDRLVHEREAVRRWLADQRLAAERLGTQSRVCLVTGQPMAAAGLFPQLKRVPGGQSAGASLVSFNAGAFESYGWDGNENAPVSRDAADICGSALNRLLDPACPDPRQSGQTLPVRRIDIGGNTAVVYWTATDAGDDFAGAFPALMEANPEQVKALYQSIWQGRMPELDRPDGFYALTLSGSQGRVIVRDWFESSVTEVATHLSQHFGDLALVRNTPAPRGREHTPALPLSLLLEALADPARNRREAVPAPLATRVLKAALGGGPYPLAALQRALQRYRAEIVRQNDERQGYQTKLWNDARAALIKAVLNRRRRLGAAGDYVEVQAAMDHKNTAPGYLLGRLMAVIERMQQEALPGVNATVVDRYFSGASASPRATFPRLLRNMRHHVRKAKDEQRGVGWLEGEADRILAGLEGFPGFLDLEQQGLFVLGYHQQRHWLWQPRATRDQPASDAAAPAPQSEH